MRGKDETGASETFQDILARHFTRRSFLQGGIAGGSLLVVGLSLSNLRTGDHSRDAGGLKFQPITPNTEDCVVVPQGYRKQVLIRWGDPLVPAAPPFDVNAQTPAAQARQFGVNCDYVAYCPQPDHRSNNSRRGLLVVNHEFSSPELMFPGYAPGNPTQSQVDTEIAAHGVSIVAVERQGQQGWRYDQGSRFNRRITGETAIEITGPAAGHPLMQVSYDPTGTRVRGTFGNCAGGKTPWGTTLTCEENFNFCFANCQSLPDTDLR
ncbi:MAG: PhoX family protein, partial [Candidatus Binatia bacterium]